ncbi:hypothetical protein HOG17_00510 [Candidatus Peregrinibacteria bacterium]|nr:hypothetical protein [Candidatus Peregrinibacteria bacterium]MBT4148665.1 hypothetical protein [Candidatus Peregrinibacteria bacterium]MBT4456004.1 hypothetical protein [Candidatus Peregrinibacteria bacterium]
MKLTLKIRKLASYLVIAGILALLAPNAYALEYGPRIEITGSATSETTEINGVVNSGTIHFTDFIPLLPNQQAHLLPVTDAGVFKHYEMRGWAWSDNLGWISFYCDGKIGAPGSNEGAACGEYSYSVRFDANRNIMSGTDDIGDGQFAYNSWAWNSAMGWMSFTSANHIPPPVSPNYGVNIDLVGGFHGYAWSPTLGYIDFEGPIAEFTDIPPPEDCDITPGVCVKIKSVIPGNEVIADGVDYHEVYVYIKDKNLNPIEKPQIVSGDYRVSFYMEWEDTLKSLQAPVLNTDNNKFEYTKAGNALKNTSTPFWNDTPIDTPIRGGVLSKPVVMFSPGLLPLPVEVGIGEDDKQDISSDEFSWIPVGYTATTDVDVDDEQLEPQMVFLIKSVAPSSDMNYSLTTEDAKAYNEDFSTLPDNVFNAVEGLLEADNLEPNKLAFKSVTWQIEQQTSPGVYEVYPDDPANGNVLKYDAVDSNGNPINLPFKPALFVSNLTGPGPVDDNKYADQLVLYRNTPMEVELGVGEGKTYAGDVPINETETKVNLFLVDNNDSEFETHYSSDFINHIDVLMLTQETEYLDPEKTIISYNNSYLNIQDEELIGLAATIQENEENLPDYFEQSAGLYTTIEYLPLGGDVGLNFSNRVSYFSNHLPRVMGSGVFNPGVEIQGINYSQGSDVESVQEGVNISSIGDININIVRDYIYKRVKQLTTNEALPNREQTETVTSIDALKTRCGSPTQFPSCHRFEMTNNDEEIYYFRTGDLVLKDWNGTDNVTIIVENGNIHIEGDLESSTGKKLALVALRDKSAGDVPAKITKVGNIYVGKNTKRIFAFIYGDGTLFPSNDFTGSAQYNDYGEPDPLSLNYFDFDKQLLIVGGLSTRNCIGCVDFAESYYYTPFRQLAINDAASEPIARLYDLNYFRSFSLGIATVDGAPVDLQCGIPTSTADFETQCPDSTIDPLNTFSEEGDLAALNKDDYAFDIKDGEELIIEGLEEGSTIIKTDKKNPLYIIYSPVNPKSFIFGEDKDLTF